MGGLPCAKRVIDSGFGVMAAIRKVQAALGKALGCMDASILLHAAEVQPTEEQLDRWKKKGDVLIAELQRHAEGYGMLAAEIEAYVSSGDGESYSPATVQGP